MVSTIATPAKLRYFDYYSFMSLADFTVWAADVEAGTADPAMHGISTVTA